MTQDVSTMSQRQIAQMFTSEFQEFKSNAARQRTPIIPEIRLSVQMTKKDVPLGTWFLIDPNVPKGDEPKMEILGEVIKFTVIRDSMRLSYFSEASNAYEIETSEFQDYTKDPVFLFDRRSQKLKISAFCPYSGPQTETIAAIRKEIIPTLPPKSNFGFEYLVYVLLPDGRVAVLKNTARGHLGTNISTGEVLDFGTISDDSFVHARAVCFGQTPGITCAHVWEAFAVPVREGEKDVRPAFRILDFIKPASIPQVKEAGHWLQENLHARYADKISYAWRNMDYNEKQQIVSSYHNLQMLLNENGGEQEAAALLLGRRTAKTAELLEGPSRDAALNKMETAKKADEAKKIEELQAESGLPPDPLPPLPDIAPQEGMYQSEIKAEDLPF